MGTLLSLHTTQMDGNLSLSLSFLLVFLCVSLSFFLSVMVLIWIFCEPTEEGEMEAQEVITRV